MKKAVLAILAILYLCSTTGATIHLHYCMGKLVDAGLWHDGDSKCDGCGMEKEASEKQGCCKDEHKHFKLEKDQKTAEQAVQFLAQPITVIPFHHYTCNDLLVSNIATSYPVSNAPPRTGDIAIFIINRTFRI